MGIKTGDIFLKGFRGTQVDVIWIERSLVPDQDFLILESKLYVVRSPRAQAINLIHPPKQGSRRKQNPRASNAAQVDDGGNVIAVRPAANDRFEIHREHSHLPPVSRTTSGRPALSFGLKMYSLIP